MSLQGKVVLVTGASNGIGRSVVERVASEGASVVINYRSDAAAAEELVNSIGKDRALAVQADAGNLDDIDRLIKAAVDRFGHIDTIMANAGLMLMRSLETTTPQDFQTMFDLNVKGPYFLAQKVVPHMPRGGRIILVSTGIAHFSLVTPNYLLYAATKGAIEQMTRVMAKELAPKGINVNSVGPGPTATALFLNGKPDAVINGIKSQNPYGRLGEPEDIANVVSFLAGKDSAWVNGQTLLANGGTMV